MIFLIHHIRKIVFLFSALLALGVYLFISSTIPSSSLQVIRLTETFAFITIIYLYFSLLASPLYSVFPRLPYKPIYIRARKATGVSTFFFALIHASFAFFGLLGGFMGLFFLSGRYLIAISFSFSALTILSIMALTSLPTLEKRLGTLWKKIHRFVYLASLLIVTHVLLIGTHFQNLTTLIPQISFAALAFLLILEALRFDKYLYNKFPNLAKYGVSLLVILALLILASAFLYLPRGSITPSLNVHSAHQQLALQASQNANSALSNTTPGLNGDRSKRYTVSFNQPENVTPGEDTVLEFSIFDASNGFPVKFFARTYEKPLHLIVVDSPLTYFNHLHPEQNANNFTITTQFPERGIYHLYVDFQPVGAIEQQMAFTLLVGSGESGASSISPNKNLTKTFGDVEVTLDTHGQLQADELTLGKEQLSFTLKDTKTKKPLTDLLPYLNSYGHLVMIKEDTYDYLHVHPYNLTVPNPNSKFGPTVDFLPIGIYGPFKPGVYRSFAQFNVNGTVFVADFTVKVS